MGNLHISEDFINLIKTITETKYIYAREGTRWTQNFSNWTSTPLKLTTSSTNDSSMFIHDSTNQKVKIGAGVSQIELTALVNWMTVSNSGEFDFQIIINGNQKYLLYNEVVRNTNINMIGSATIPPFVVDVNEGDEIQLCIFGNVSSAVILRTHLLIKKIK